MDHNFSHIGIPTADDRTWDGFHEPGRIYYTDFSQDEFGIEFMEVRE